MTSTSFVIEEWWEPGPTDSFFEPHWKPVYSIPGGGEGSEKEAKEFFKALTKGHRLVKRTTTETIIDTL